MPIYSNLSIYFLACTLFFAAGCTAQGEEPAQTVVHDLIEEPSFLGILGDRLHVAQRAVLSRTDYLRASQERLVMAGMTAGPFNSAYLDGSDLRTLARMAGEIRAQQMAPEVRYIVEAGMALRMVRMILATDAPDRALLGIYTNLLVEHRSPHGHEIAAALELLQGHWSELEIQESAARTREAVLHMINSDCSGADCARRTATLDTEAANRVDYQRAAIAGSLAALTSL